MIEQNHENNYENNLEQVVQENCIIRPFKKILYAISPDKIVLDHEQYCHIFNKKTGVVKAIEGPEKKVLDYDEQLAGSIENKIVVPENCFCIIANPFDSDTTTIQYGKREVRKGPKNFALHPGENVKQIREEYILTKYESLLIKAIADFNDENNGETHNSGDEFLVKGPRTYIPSKDEQVVREIKGIPLSDTEGIYVQNKDTGDARLVKGSDEETIYFLQPNEKLFNKELTRDELEGLGLVEQRGNAGVRILTRQAANGSYLENKSNALVLELEDNEVVYIYDGSESRIEKGPKTTFLGPYERPKVLNLSGGKPIKQGALKVALLKLGPDFIYDRIPVRTKDNAPLRIDVTYKWKFNLVDADLKKAFTLEDFVGYVAETLSSEIRSVAARYDFEDFHANALQYIKEEVFEDQGRGIKSRLFDENNLEIFDIDITSITPEDADIAKKLHDAIKKNMDIYCDKLVLKATLEAERQRVEGEINITEEKKKLIELQNKNKRLEIIEDANIRAESQKIEAQGRAEAEKIITATKTEAEKQRLDTIISALTKEGGEAYLNLRRAESFENAEKLVVVPSDSKLVLPFANLKGEY